MIEARHILQSPESRLEEARRRLPAFTQLVAGVPYESGRARGQSTLLLALALPSVPILSVERSDGTADARIAEARLAPLANVSLRYGDAFEELPREVSEEDVVVIDGPKGWHALQLAIELMRDRHPAAVFVHDCYHGLDQRTFLERHVPETFFSDEPAFEELAAHLDEPCFEAAHQSAGEGWSPHRFDGAVQDSYGPTYACIPYIPDVDYAAVRRKMAFSRAIRRIRHGARKRLFGNR